jgi:predicted transcriptional regulator
MPRRYPMHTMRTPFAGLSAAEVMSHTVISIPEEMILRSAAQLFIKEGIGGAPVVDAEGRCSGILTSSDFLALWADDECKHAKEEVRRHMTTDPVMVRPSTPITELARMMIDAHIHRLVVVDSEHRPVGIVSSTNVLAAVAYRHHEVSK